MKMEQTEYSETSAYKIQTSGNFPEERIQHFSFTSNFRHVLNVVCFILRNSPASEFYMPTFRNTVCSIFISR